MTKAQSAKYIGKTYVFFVPPGFLIGGTVHSVVDNVFRLRDCVYLDGCAVGCSNVSDVPFSITPEAMRGAVTRTFPCPDDTEIRVDAALIKWPCRQNFTPLTEDAAREALK